METFLQILINFGLAVIGLYTYALVACRKHIGDKTFKWRIFYNENYLFWMWAAQIELAYIVIMSIFPSIELLFAKKIIGLVNNIATFELIPLTEVSESVTKAFVYLFGAWLLSWVVNKGLKRENKIGKTKS